MFKASDDQSLQTLKVLLKPRIKHALPLSRELRIADRNMREYPKSTWGPFLGRKKAIRNGAAKACHSVSCTLAKPYLLATAGTEKGSYRNKATFHFGVHWRRLMLAWLRITCWHSLTMVPNH